MLVLPKSKLLLVCCLALQLHLPWFLAVGHWFLATWQSLHSTAVVVCMLGVCWGFCSMPAIAVWMHARFPQARSAAMPGHHSHVRSACKAPFHAQHGRPCSGRAVSGSGRRQAVGMQVITPFGVHPGRLLCWSNPKGVALWSLSACTCTGEDLDKVGGAEAENSFMTLSDTSSCGKMTALAKLLDLWYTQENANKVVLCLLPSPTCFHAGTCLHCTGSLTQSLTHAPTLSCIHSLTYHPPRMPCTNRLQAMQAAITLQATVPVHESCANLSAPLSLSLLLQLCYCSCCC